MRKSKSLFIVSFLISLITIFVYLPALQNEFVNWDDHEYVYENPNIQSFNRASIKWMLTAFHSANWHPVTWFSHAIDYAIWGLNPMGHHLTSVIFHGFNTFLVVILITHLIHLRNDNSYKQRYPLIAGAITGLLFGLHPLHVESVAWVSDRKDVLYAFFFLLSILMYIKYVSAEQRRKGLLYGLCLFFFILSLMSKPMAVTLPVVLLILDLYPLERLSLKRIFISQRKVLMEKLPFLGLSLVSVVLTILSQQQAGAIKSIEPAFWGDGVLIAVKALSFYIYKMIWPTGLAPLYPYPSEISIFKLEYIISILFVLSASIYCFFTWEKKKYLSVIWAYYVITLLPVSGIIKIGDQAAADRYTYLPGVGIFLLIGLVIAGTTETALHKKLKRFYVIVIAVVLVTILLSILTIKQIRIWKDSITLWSTEMRLLPKTTHRAHFNLGHALQDAGFIDEAIEQYRYALRLTIDDPKIHTNLGGALESKGQFDKAIEHYLIALKIKPDYTEAHYNLGNVYYAKSLFDRAIIQYKIAVEIEPDFVEAHSNLGNAYYAKGLFDKAISHYEIAVEIEPDIAKTHNNLGNAYRAKGLYDRAISHYKIAVEIEPDIAEVHYNLAIAYNSKGLTEKANKHFRAARQLNPTLFKRTKSQN